MLAGIPAKRFTRDMALAAEYTPAKTLTQPQRAYLVHLVWRYRRQLEPIDPEAVRLCRPPHLSVVPR